MRSFLVVVRSAVKLMPPDRAVPEPDQLEAVRVFSLCISGSIVALNTLHKQQDEERTGTSSRAGPKTEHMLMPIGQEQGQDPPLTRVFCMA